MAQGAVYDSTRRARPERASHGAGSVRTPQKDGISWGYISKPLPERVRVEVVERFKASRGDFARWKRQDWELICEAMVWVEDRLEIEHPGRKADRELLRDARRSLEVVLWP